ncbi:MAG: hypothetical protein Q4G24_06060 [Paracoccus sp. (in: a-proteobacteria)]|uniref:hypothetical protein n=1 Tax=Paracoccus sp. TaxID=267 RepID=UPI0026DF41D1|nr:hypothetical protein [Paracoccus sp. (in: a-proteobacteria)]MDO5621019.1 hypothetical protein [Paracoccus sp. (in: a-proteobacteria)]
MVYGTGAGDPAPVLDVMMRDFFILWAERLISVLVALMLLIVLVAAGGFMFAPAYAGGSVLIGLVVLCLGGVATIVMAGQLYLFFGIYRNTLRINNLLEQNLRK